VRTEDRERLLSSFSKTDDYDAGNAEFEKALGCWAPNWRALFAAVLADLDSDELGIRWWKDQLPAQERILISDQLIVCASSVGQNMREAWFHLLELRAARDEATKLAAMRFRGGPLAPMAPASGADELSMLQVETHLSGVFRALGSAFDCLAATIIGVAAVPQRILRADFQALSRYLSEPTPTDASPDRLWHAELGKDLRSIVEAAGPTNWLSWAMDFRNMLVHRGRHTTFKYVDGKQSPIVSPTGDTIYTATVHYIPPLDPGRAEVEVLRDGRDLGFFLKEDAGATVEELAGSTLYVVEKTCVKLLTIWSSRRASPGEHIQPKSQWHPKDHCKPSGFPGYASGVLNVEFDQIRSGGLVVRRMAAAGLTTGQIDAVWGPKKSAPKL
jgi:hypothetical protein